MVVIDSSFLLLLFYPDAGIPLKKDGSGPVPGAVERVEHLIDTLNANGETVIVPANVLAEVLVKAQGDVAGIIAALTNNYKVQVADFDVKAAIELSLMTPERGSTEAETRAKIKFDQQILAIAKVRQAKTIYTADDKLAARAVAQSIKSVALEDLPMPPQDPQQKLDLSRDAGSDDAG